MVLDCDRDRDRDRNRDRDRVRSHDVRDDLLKNNLNYTIVNDSSIFKSYHRNYHHDSRPYIHLRHGILKMIHFILKTNFIRTFNDS